MVKRKRVVQATSKPSTTTATITAQLPPRSRANGRHSQTTPSTNLESLELDRLHSSESADLQHTRGLSAMTTSVHSNGHQSITAPQEMDTHDLSSHLEKTSASTSHSPADPIYPPNGRSRPDRTKTSSSNSTNSTTENPSILQVSVTESASTTDATPSLVNGRATASESLSSLSEVDTVDSEADTERIDEFDDELEEIELPAMDDVVDDDIPDEEIPEETVAGIGTSEDDGSSDQTRGRVHSRTSSNNSPSRGRKRRRRENGEEEGKAEHIESSDEHLAKRSRKGSNDDDIKAGNQVLEEPEDLEEAIDEDQPDESKPGLARLT
jgi:hypothetical protein